MSLSINVANEILRQYDLTCKEPPSLLSTNSAATIFHCDRTIIKQSDDLWLLKTEALMLQTLKRAGLLVPHVYGVGDRGLVSEYIPSNGGINKACEIEAADMLVALHENTAKAFGFEQDTTIGPYPQSNPWTASWKTFYAEQRLLPFTLACEKEGRLSALHVKRMEKLLYKLPDLISEPKKPSLLHGDVWGGNVLTRDGHIAAFIDPACYYGHFEMELAFIAMFNTFGKAFFHRYNEQRLIEPGFFEERLYLYQLFPYLVHVRAFGGSYVGGVEDILRRFGC